MLAKAPFTDHDSLFKEVCKLPEAAADEGVLWLLPSLDYRHLSLVRNGPVLVASRTPVPAGEEEWFRLEETFHEGTGLARRLPLLPE